MASSRPYKILSSRSSQHCFAGNSKCPSAKRLRCTAFSQSATLPSRSEVCVPTHPTASTLKHTTSHGKQAILFSLLYSRYTLAPCAQTPPRSRFSSNTSCSQNASRSSSAHDQANRAPTAQSQKARPNLLSQQIPACRKPQLGSPSGSGRARTRATQAATYPRRTRQSRPTNTVESFTKPTTTRARRVICTSTSRLSITIQSYLTNKMSRCVGCHHTHEISGKVMSKRFLRYPRLLRRVG